MPFLRKYATATHIYIPIVKRAVVDFAVSADWTPAAGDVKISIDGAAAANVTNLPTAVTMGNTAMWDFSMTTGEMTGKQMCITVADAATKAVEDQMFIVETYGNASAMYQADFSAANLPAQLGNVAHGGAAATLELGSSSSTPALYVHNSGGDASQFTSTGGNGHGVIYTGAGAGDGLHAIGGATGNGIKGQGGSTSGSGLHVTAQTSGDGITATKAGTGKDINATLLAVTTCTTNTDMRGTDNAALAVTWTGTLATNLGTLAGHDPGGVLATSANQTTILSRIGTPVGASISADIATNLAKWTTAITESYAADGSAPTPEQALMMIMQSLHEFAISGTTRTVKKLDGSTTAMTFTLDDATNPTSTTRSL